MFSDTSHQLCVHAHLQDMYAAVGVCRSWRSVGFEQFFLSRWAAPDATIIHPLQLLALVRAPWRTCTCVCTHMTPHWAAEPAVL